MEKMTECLPHEIIGPVEKMEPANNMSTFAGSMVSLGIFQLENYEKPTFDPSQVGKKLAPPERLIGWTIIMIVVIVAGCLTAAWNWICVRQQI